MADKKDEIISMQLDLIRQMTENNIRRLSTDIWGNAAPEKKDSQKETEKKLSRENSENEGAKELKKDLTKASDSGFSL